MRKGMIPALLVCFFGAAAAAACDPELLARPLAAEPVVSEAQISSPRPCREAKTEEGCDTLPMCVWVETRCKERDFAVP